MTAFILVGGAIKGVFGHLAFLKALEERGIRPDLILGASAGAIIGSFYAAGKTIEQMYHTAMNFHKDDYIDFVPWYKLIFQIINSGKNLKGILYGNVLEKYLERELGENNDFAKLQIPLYIGVINLTRKRIELMHSGKISKIARASTGIPTVYYPQKIDDCYYIDGAIGADNLPLLITQKEPNIDRIFISNFTGEIRKKNNNFLEGKDWPLLEIINRTIDSVLYSLDRDSINDIPIYTITPTINIDLSFIDPIASAREIAYNQALESCRAKIKELKL